MSNIDSLVQAIMEAPFSSDGDRMLALNFLNEALVKLRVDVERANLEEALAKTIDLVKGFSAEPLEM